MSPLKRILAVDTQSAMHRNLEYRTLEALQKGVLNFFLGGAPRFDV